MGSPISNASHQTMELKINKIYSSINNSTAHLGTIRLRVYRESANPNPYSQTQTPDASEVEPDNMDPAKDWMMTRSWMTTYGKMGVTRMKVTTSIRP
jgi:hypothetical protein